jgi:type ISP restriction-modification system protein
MLRKRWRVLLYSDREGRKLLFKDSPTGRKVHEPATQVPPSGVRLKPISELPKDGQEPRIIRYTYRSFDRQYVFADARLLDRSAPGLWSAHGDRQIYLTSLLNHPLGQGAAATVCAQIPDLHHFRGSYGAKEIFPLYRVADASEANIMPGLLDLLGRTYKRTLGAEDFMAYIYGVLAQPAFTNHFVKELENRELRVSITKDAALFEQVRDIGARLLWLHTYGERFIPKGKQRGRVPRGEAKCTKAIPGNSAGYPETFEYSGATRILRVGAGEFGPVLYEVFEFEISGLKVVQSWLRYRMKNGAGKKSSRLDEVRSECWPSQFTTELLELLWILEATVAGYREQSKLMEAIVTGECVKAEELPAIPEVMREPPRARTTEGPLLNLIHGS